jgi:hypothetical protein
MVTKRKPSRRTRPPQEIQIPTEDPEEQAEILRRIRAGDWDLFFRCVETVYPLERVVEITHVH